MDKLYQQHDMAGLTKDAFAQRLLCALDVTVEGVEDLQSAIPAEGPVVIASNHPFGGIEGVILSLLIGQVRPDLKVLANQGLQIFPELRDYFIFTNPLSEKDPKNGPSLRTSLKHVKQGGALLIFPAGRVSYYRKDKKRISEHGWNRIVGRLITATNAQYLPVFISGENSRWFYRMGRIHDRLRMFMLARELLNKKHTKVRLNCHRPVPPSHFDSSRSLDENAELCRIMSYAQDPRWSQTWPADKQIEMKPIAPEADSQQLSREIHSLPPDQHLTDYKHYSVWFGYQHQMPTVVTEIARLREIVFREHNEGSGEPIDTDHFDATYTQLFVFNNKTQKIIGAYRMGRTDVLLQQGGMSELYLSRMFDFKPEFVNQQGPCLELGRSFLIPEYQKSFQGLFLLWRGIGAFVCRFPQYHTLYGTVSISKLYNPKSVALMQDTLVTPTQKVAPHNAFDMPLHPEIKDFKAEYALTPHVSSLLACIESDGKDIPVLARHYQKLGAVFHCIGIDRNFNDTPGMLLSVDLRNAPQKLLKLYLGADYRGFLDAAGSKPDQAC